MKRQEKKNKEKEKKVEKKDKKPEECLYMIGRRKQK